jgi:hypothetical protein
MRASAHAGRRWKRRPVRPTLLVVIATAVVAAWVLPAQATVINRERFSEPISEDYDLCGIAVHEEGQVTGTIQFRAGTGELESTFFQHLTYRVATTITNPANGKFYTFTAHAVVQDVKATPVEGTIFEFTFLEAGQPFVIRDMNGNVVLRDRGVIRSTLLFDTLGDDMPGGDVVEFLADVVRGPHPQFSMSEEEFCATVQDLIG